jgi:hypothetical protein
LMISIYTCSMDFGVSLKTWWLVFPPRLTLFHMQIFIVIFFLMSFFIRVPFNS